MRALQLRRGYAPYGDLLREPKAVTSRSRVEVGPLQRFFDINFDTLCGLASTCLREAQARQSAASTRHFDTSTALRHSVSPASTPPPLLLVSGGSEGSFSARSVAAPPAIAIGINR